MCSYRPAQKYHERDRNRSILLKDVFLAVTVNEPSVTAGLLVTKHVFNLSSAARDQNRTQNDAS